MGGVHQPLLLLAIFLISFLSITTLIQAETRKLGKSNAASRKSKGIRGNNPFDPIYHPDSGAGFQNMGGAKDGSKKVIDVKPELLLHGLFPGFPFGLGFPFGFGFPLGWLGGYGGYPSGVGGYGGHPGGIGGYPGGAGGYGGHPGGISGYPGGVGGYGGHPGGGDGYPVVGHEDKAKVEGKD